MFLFKYKEGDFIVYKDPHLLGKNNIPHKVTVGYALQYKSIEDVYNYNKLEILRYFPSKNLDNLIYSEYLSLICHIVRLKTEDVIKEKQQREIDMFYKLTET